MTTTKGAERIARERARQVEAEGYTDEHDRHHSANDFIDAAIAYASPNDASLWPWEEGGFKPESGAAAAHGTVRDLEKAGALIAAAIDRLLSAGGER